MLTDIRTLAYLLGYIAKMMKRLMFEMKALAGEDGRELADMHCFLRCPDTNDIQKWVVCKTRVCVCMCMCVCVCVCMCVCSICINITH
jgi:hypothetical protein